MKIAVVGMSSPSNEEAPFGEMECWALAMDKFSRPRANLLFEMHQREAQEEFEAFKDVDYGTVVWQYPPETQGEVEFIQYPLKEVIASIGVDWFSSTIAYMIALAISKKPEEIHIYGVHMAAEDEYVYQRANLCWLIGLAEGRGIKVIVQEGSYLRRYHPQFPEYPKRYGYL